MEKFLPCRKCTEGWIIDIENDHASKCQCLISYQNKINIDSIIENSNLPLQVKDYSVDKYIGPDENKNIDKLKKFISSFGEKFRNISLYCFGKNSTQKTTVCSWVSEQIALNGFSVHYTTMNELVKNLCNEQYDEEVKTIIEKYKSVDLLILDESFDKSKVTVYRSNFQIPFMDSFLRDRIEKNKRSTIFISNVSIENIDSSFGVSLVTLIKRNCINSTMEFKDSVNIANNFLVEDLWKD